MQLMKALHLPKKWINHKLQQLSKHIHSIGKNRLLLHHWVRNSITHLTLILQKKNMFTSNSHCDWSTAKETEMKQKQIGKVERKKLKFIRFQNSVLHTFQLTQFGGTFSWCQLDLAWKSATKLCQLNIVQKSI